MSVKTKVRRQYQAILNRAANSSAELESPPEGWIATARKALGMSGRQLGKRLGLSHSAIAQAERQEREGGVSLGYMERVASAMGCRFVYAIVPEASVEAVLREQARAKAHKLVQRSSGHMALESQSLSKAQLQQQIDQLSEDLLYRMPADFWDEA